MPKERKYHLLNQPVVQAILPTVDKSLQDYAKLQGLMLYQFMAMRSALVPFTNEVMEMNRIGLASDTQQRLGDWAERQKSAINFQRYIETFGSKLFGSAVYEGETFLAENDLFSLTHIPVKKGVKKKASMFHLGGFVPYSDNLFRLLPNANFFDRFIENGIDVYEMKCKSESTQYNAHLLELSIEKIIETTHAFSDIAFAHGGEKKMILEGYCGTGINTYTSYLADMAGMARKFELIVTFVSPIDARQCTIFEQMHEILAYLNPSEASVDGHTISSLLDTIQDRSFEKTPMGALTHGWKNKEYAKVEKIEDLTPRQQSELTAWYWLSLKHGSYYPLSKDLYAFYSKLFTQGVSKSGVLPYEYKGKSLNLTDLKKTKVKVLAFLGDKDHLVDAHTADVLHTILGKQCEVVIHEKTGHVAYIFNPQRWQKDDPRAFKPDIIETIFRNLPAATQPEKAAAAKVAPTKPALVKPAPAKATPAKVSAAKPAPVKAAPTKPTPLKAAPAKATAAKLAPVKVAPVKAVAAKPAPAKATVAKSAAPAKAPPVNSTSASTPKPKAATRKTAASAKGAAKGSV